LLIIPLHTQGTPTLGFLLLADKEQRQWSRHLLTSLETLTKQFAWFRLHRYRTKRQAQENQALQTLNWYKHRCLETLHQSVTQSISALLDFHALTPSPLYRSGSNRPNLNDLTRISTTAISSAGQPLQQMRRKQLLQQLRTDFSDYEASPEGRGVATDSELTPLTLGKHN
jgi:hypothetical protein